MAQSKGLNLHFNVLAALMLAISGFPALSRAQTTSCPAGYQASQFSTDPIAISTEGQRCTGGGSTVVMAFSDGSRWKCL